MNFIRTGLLLCAVLLSTPAVAATTGTLVPSSQTHQLNVSSTTSSISMQWTGLTAGAAKGALTYEYVLDQTATHTQTTFNTALATPPTATLLNGTLAALNVALVAVPDGTYYFHLRGYDSDGPLSGSGVVNFGPIILNSKPAFAASNPVSPATGGHKNAVSLTISGSKFMAGVAVDLINGTTVVPLTGVTRVSPTSITATVPAGTAQATYGVRVKNPAPWSQSTTLPAAYQSTNTAPVANAGTGATLTIAVTSVAINLSGSTSSDADGDPLTYLWTVTAAPAGSVVVVNATYATATKALTVSTTGTYTFSLMVNDGFTNSTAATVSYVVNQQNVNNPPTANAGPAQLVASNAVVTLTGLNSTDPDANTVLSYAWTIVSQPATSAVALSSAIAAQPTFTPVVSGSYQFQLIVTDNAAIPLSSQPASVVITVNNPPTANAGTNRTVAATQLVTLDGTGSTDPENDALTYAWVITSQPGGAGLALSSSIAAKPSFTPSVVGAYVFSLSVTDAVGNVSATAATVTITVASSFTYNYTFTKNAATTSVTAIGFILSATGITTADQLAAAIPNSDLVSRWDSLTQSYISHTPGSPFNNFSLVAGEAYFISVAANSTLALTGTLPTITYTFVKNIATTSVTAIGLRQGSVAGGTTTADLLATAIVGSDLVSSWDPATQAYISHTPASPFNNFNLSDSAAYFVSVTQNATW